MAADVAPTTEELQRALREIDRDLVLTKDCTLQWLGVAMQGGNYLRVTFPGNINSRIFVIRYSPPMARYIAQEHGSSAAVATITPERAAASRVDKANDNRDVKPRDILRCALHEIDEHEAKGETCDAAYVVIRYLEKNGSWHIRTYRANLSREQEIALLELKKVHTIEDWRNS